MLAPENLIRLHNERIDREVRARQLVRQAEAALREQHKPLFGALGRRLIAIGRRLAGGQRQADPTAPGPEVAAELPTRSSMTGAPAHARANR